MKSRTLFTPGNLWSFTRDTKRNKYIYLKAVFYYFVPRLSINLSVSRKLWEIVLSLLTVSTLSQPHAFTDHHTRNIYSFLRFSYIMAMTKKIQKTWSPKFLLNRPLFNNPLPCFRYIITMFSYVFLWVVSGSPKKTDRWMFCPWRAV